MLCYGTNCSDWWIYGRWIVVALIVVFLAVAAYMYFRKQSINRLNIGQPPLQGTAWMVPNSRQHHQQQEYPMNPMTKGYVPPYYEHMSPNDAGYYDQNGNFIANVYPYNQPNYAPPAGPPPPSTDTASYYSPPPGPPPGPPSGLPPITAPFGPPPGPPPPPPPVSAPASGEDGGVAPPPPAAQKQ